MTEQFSPLDISRVPETQEVTEQTIREVSDFPLVSLLLSILHITICLTTDMFLVIDHIFIFVITILLVFFSVLKTGNALPVVLNIYKKQCHI